MQEVVVQTSELPSNREATERAVKILNSTYENSDLDKVAMAVVHIYKYQWKKLLILLTEF